MKVFLSWLEVLTVIFVKPSLHTFSQNFPRQTMPHRSGEAGIFSQQLIGAEVKLLLSRICSANQPQQQSGRPRITCCRLLGRSFHQSSDVCSISSGGSNSPSAGSTWGKPMGKGKTIQSKGTSGWSITPFSLSDSSPSARWISPAVELRSPCWTTCVSSCASRLFPTACSRVVLSSGEHNVIAHREGHRVHCPRRLGRGRACVNPHPTEIMTKARLHRKPALAHREVDPMNLAPH